MKTRSWTLALLLSAPALLVLSCSSDSDSTADNKQIPVSQNSIVSECGGFTTSTALRSPDDYCDAEKLRWSYNGASRLLTLVNTRVALNCCGDHSVDVFFDSDSNVYEALETDAPQGDQSRCKCSCVFDFRTEIANVDVSTFNLVVRRHVTDEGAPQHVWTGALHLENESGEVVISETPAFGCVGTE